MAAFIITAVGTSDTLIWLFVSASFFNAVLCLFEIDQFGLHPGRGDEIVVCSFLHIAFCHFACYVPSRHSVITSFPFFTGSLCLLNTYCIIRIFSVFFTSSGLSLLRVPLLVLYISLILKKPLRGLSPRANYTDRDRSLSAKLVPIFTVRGLSRSRRRGSPYDRNLGFLDRFLWYYGLISLLNTFPARKDLLYLHWASL
jgi:hypothetical protein